MNKLRHRLSYVVVKRDVEYALRVRRNFKMAALQNCDIRTTERRDKHAHFEYDILTSTRFGFLRTISSGITHIIRSHKYDPETSSVGPWADFAFESLDDRKASSTSVCKYERIKTELMKNKFELLARRFVVPVNDENPLLSICFFGGH